MTNIGIWVPILMATFLLFIFYTSGAIIFELLRFKVQNSFAYIAGGFFAYFTFISIFSFPLQLFSILPYVFFIYYLWTLTIIYLIFCLVFLRHWITISFFSKNSLIFIVCVGLMATGTFLTYTFLTDSSFARHKNILSIILWLRDNPVSFFNNSTFYNFLGFKPFESWYTFQLSAIIISSASSYQIQDIIIPFMFIIEVFLSASIFIAMFESFSKLKSKWIELIAMFLCLIVFIVSKNLLMIYGFAFWSGEMMLINLIFYAVVLTLRYTSMDCRERHKAAFIGVVIGGYISFSWDNSYHIVFFLYCLFFVIQRKYTRNFMKDILKILMFPIISLCFYNIILKLYIQAIIFSALLLILAIIAFSMRNRYSAVIKFETFVDNRIRLVTLLVPGIFMIISLGMSLNSGKGFFNSQDSYLNFIYAWTNFIRGESSRFYIVLVLSLAIIVFALTWVLFRNRIKKDFLTDSIDLALLLHLTFYNPIVLKFINVFYHDITSSNGLIMLIQGFIFINILMIWLCNKIQIKKNESLKIIQNYNWLKQ